MTISQLKKENEFFELQLQNDTLRAKLNLPAIEATEKEKKELVIRCSQRDFMAGKYDEIEVKFEFTSGRKVFQPVIYKKI